MFSTLQSHYLFEDKFGRPGKGNDKGHVEGLVKYSRAKFMVPLPVVDSCNGLNAMLLDKCTKRRVAILRGHKVSIEVRLQEDRRMFMALPPAAFDPCCMVTSRVSSTSLVRYRTNDYSVPTRYGHQEVLLKAYVDRIEVIWQGHVIASHVRSYEHEDFIANPLHYLALLEHKPRALDQAAPLDGWLLSEPVHRLRRLMEARMGKHGKREFIQVLRLCEHFEQPLVEAAVADALRLGAISFDAVKMLASGGRLVVISFHSLEDRIVKEKFRTFAKAGRVKLLVKKPLRPTDTETINNPRSRSARLRVVEKIK